jgi:excisionase family DNA binding protein
MMAVLLTCAQAAAWLRLSEGTIRKMAREGNIPCISIGDGLRFIAAELEDWFGLKFRFNDPGAKHG